MHKAGGAKFNIPYLGLYKSIKSSQGLLFSKARQPHEETVGQGRYLLLPLQEDHA